MATGRVETPNEVFLNNHHFPIVDGVTRRPVNEFAEKTVIGPFTEDSDPFLSAITWRDFSGGQGRFLFDVNKPEHVTQFWTGAIRNDIPGHIVPQPGTITSPGMLLSVGGGDTTQVIVDRVVARPPAGAVWAVSTDGSTGHRLGRATSSLDNYQFIANLASRPLDIAAGQVNGVTQLTIAESTTVQWAYTTPGMSASAGLFTDTSKMMQSLTYWQDLLWGISNSGQLSFSAETSDTTSLNWVDVGRATINDTNTVRKLTTAAFKLPGVEDLEHLVLIRNDGFDIYNRVTERFVPALRLPASSAAGNGGIEWNQSFYYPYGLSLYQWTPGPGGNVVTDVGLTTNEGVPEAQAGVIFDVAASPRQLFVSVQPTDTTEHSRVYTRTGNTGWTQFAKSDAGIALTSPMYVGSWPFDDYVLVPGWATSFSPNNDETFRLDLNQHSIVTDSRVNQISFLNGDAAGSQAVVVSPWITADANQDWNAIKFSVEVSHLRSSVAVGISQSSFALDYATEFNDTAWSNLISVNTSTVGTGLFPEGRFEVTLPSATNAVGTPFTSIRWRARWGALNNNAYDLHNVSLVFEKRPKLRYMFSFDIDLRKSYKGRSVKEMREFIDEFIRQKTLAEFTYHPDDPGGDKTYFVRAINPISQQETGKIERDFIRMQVMELV